jgi:hypothetical protein
LTRGSECPITLDCRTVNNPNEHTVSSRTKSLRVSIPDPDNVGLLLAALYDWRKSIQRTTAWNEELQAEEQRHLQLTEYFENPAAVRHLRHLRESLAMARGGETFAARRVAELLGVPFDEAHHEQGIWQNLTRSTTHVRASRREY